MRNICPLYIMFIIIITTYILRLDVYIYIYTSLNHKDYYFSKSAQWVELNN